MHLMNIKKAISLNLISYPFYPFRFYARMIDSLARNYKLPVENIVSSIQVTEEGPAHRAELHSPVNHGVKSDTLVNIES